MDTTIDIATMRLKQAGLRPTRQRVVLARLLFNGEDHHVTAEQLHQQTRATDTPVSLATVYNTLHQLTRVGLLHQVVAEPGHCYFDTNLEPHHHFYHTCTGRLEDIHGGSISVSGLPPVPDGAALARVDVIVRLTSNG